MIWWEILLVCCGAVLLLGTVATLLILCVLSCRDNLRRCESIYRGDEQLLAMVTRLPVEWAGVKETLQNHLNRLSAFDRESKKRDAKDRDPENAEEAVVALGGTVLEPGANGVETPAFEKLSKLERLGRIGQMKRG